MSVRPDSDQLQPVGVHHHPQHRAHPKVRRGGEEGAEVGEDEGPRIKVQVEDEFEDEEDNGGEGGGQGDQDHIHGRPHQPDQQQTAVLLDITIVFVKVSDRV